MFKNIQVCVIIFCLSMTILTGCNNSDSKYESDVEVTNENMIKIITVTYIDDTVEVFECVKGWVQVDDGFLIFNLYDGKSIKISGMNIKKTEEKVIKY